MNISEQLRQTPKTIEMFRNPERINMGDRETIKTIPSLAITQEGIVPAEFYRFTNYILYRISTYSCRGFSFTA